MKSKFFKIKLTPYNKDLYVSYAQTDMALKAAMKKYKFSKKHMEFFMGGFEGSTAVAYRNEGNFFLRFKSVEDKNKLVGLVAHEAFHVTTDLFDYIGDKFNSDYNSEAYAYLIQYITTKILKKIN